MEILMIPTYIIMARIFAMMILILFASGKLASTLKSKLGEESIMKKVISLENILALAGYLILFYLLSYLWPLGWEAFTTSEIFWPVQGLVILAIIGWFGLQRLKFLPWFFLTSAIVLAVAGLTRDPRINPPPEKYAKASQIPYVSLPAAETKTVFLYDDREPEIPDPSAAMSSENISKKVFEIPADKSQTGIWHLPANPNGRGWNFRFDYEGKIKWYTRDNSSESFIELNGQDIDIGFTIRTI